MMKKMVKRMITAVLVCLFCISAPCSVWASADITADVSETEAKDVDENIPAAEMKERTKPLHGSSDLTSAKMVTDQYMLIKVASDTKWIWNINNTGKGRNDCVHLDDNSGFNCTMQLEEVTSNGVTYYSIRYSDSSYYIDSEGDNDKTNKVLHNGETERNQDNQLFRFVPVKDADGKNKKNTYYIMSKKGDNSGKELYIGFHDDGKVEEGRKIATTNQKVEWIVETAVPEAPANASHFTGDDGANAMVMIAPEGYKRGVTVQSDGLADGNDIQLWMHGTSAKVELFWNDTYQAYKLRSRSLEERATSPIDFVWDIENRSFANDAQVHIWSENSNNLAQYWRFISCGDGCYYIQNAYTGTYLTVENGKDEDGANVITTDNPIKWRVDVLNNITQKSDGTIWMSGIPDDTLLSEINIPATHDTGTAESLLSESEDTSFVKCQQLYFNQQMAVGVRAFDVRCGIKYSNGEIPIIHGMNSPISTCIDKGGDILTLKTIFDQAANFLKLHDSETIILIIKNDDGYDEEIAEAVDSYISSGKYPIYFPFRTDQMKMVTPTMGDVRGKIVLMRRYGLGDYYPDNSSYYFEPYLEKWDTMDYSKFTEDTKAVEIYHQTDTSVWVQDAYKEDVAAKTFYVAGTWNQASREESGIPSSGYVINYTSGTGGNVIPINYSRSMNEWLLSDNMRADQHGKRLGIFMMNFVDGNLSRLVYENNHLITKSVFPDQVTMTYGEKLGDVELETDETTGTLAFEDPEIMPLPSDSNKTLYTLVFTPYDSGSPVQKKDITVTVEKKKLVYLFPHWGKITFGSKTPLDYEGSVMYESDLVPGDSADDIHLETEIFNEYGDRYDPDTLTEDTILPTGVYELRILNADTASDKYYPVAYHDREGDREVVLSVMPLDVTWKWNNKYVYKVGEPLDLTAEITNQMPGYPVEVTEYYYSKEDTRYSSYDKKTGEWYIDVADFSHLSDERTYKAPHFYETATYYIVKAEDDPDLFPEKTKLIEGSTLKSASIGDSKFKDAHLEFAKDLQDKVMQIKDSGKYTVYLVMDDTGDSVPLGEINVDVVAREDQAVNQTNSSQKTGESVKTGDENQMIPWIAVICGSMAVIAGCGIGLKRKRKKQ